MNPHLQKIDEYRWAIPRAGNMNVPALVFSNEQLLQEIMQGRSLQQLVNVAALPGIVGSALAMPDIHWGYGFPIGGVAAFETDSGVVSPGGVGYDINCGCRIMTTLLRASEVRPFIKHMVQALFHTIPTGVGSSGNIRLSRREETKVAVEGAAWAVKKGYGRADDLERTEDRGTMEGADPSVLSDRALKRGKDQLGTLGSGNHFIEIQVVDTIYDEKVATLYGLFTGQLTLFIHSGSRGFGHQICDDFIKALLSTPLPSKHKALQIPDRQLACAPLKSEMGRRYLAAMACAANYAWANRQILMHWTEETLCRTLEIPHRELGMQLVYDVAHNIAKKEPHTVQGERMTVCVHRKGATRSLPPGHPLVPDAYMAAGQPVLIPGDMGSCSYILAGSEGAMSLSFGSSCHGAGRVLSRSQAIKRAKGRSINRELEDKGIFVHSRGKRTLKEEMPEAYKDVSQVVNVIHGAGLARKVARLRPLGVIKG